MSLTSEQRQSIDLQHEGIVINNAGAGNPEATIECTFCMIDGQVSGLLRIAEPEEIAAFLFPLVDRVVRGIRGATMIPQALQKFQQPAEPPVIEVQVPIVEPVAKAAAKQWPWWAVPPLAVIAGSMILAFAIQHGHWGE